MTTPPAQLPRLLRGFLKNGSQRADVFQVRQNGHTGCWRESRYSQRRQALLASQAALTGNLDALPSGPKVERIRARLSKLQEHVAFEQDAVNIRYAPPAPAQQEPGTKGARRRSAQDLEFALATAKVEGYKGPYSGRNLKKMFKGQKVDKEARERKENVRIKLEGMKQIVNEWQESNAEAKSKVKPGLPF